METGLNDRAAALCGEIIRAASDLRVRVEDDGDSAVRIDCGIDARGSLEAGCRVAEVCMSGLGQVRVTANGGQPWPVVETITDDPYAACLLSQYAGWQVSEGEYFAMGSGPMRLLAAQEPMLQQRQAAEQADVGVGVLESATMPDSAVCAQIAKKCDIDHRRLTLLVAPTSSFAGAIQIVARSVETAMHKLNELEFDVTAVVAGLGRAPLPPVGGDDLVAMGRTNDAILYGGQVTLWMDGEDSNLERIVKQMPSSASPDYGRPFAELFAAYDHDFYRVDKLLFSPAQITLVNVQTGRSFSAGKLAPEVIRQSFGG